jgi:dienelactone hydrolase
VADLCRLKCFNRHQSASIAQFSYFTGLSACCRSFARTSCRLRKRNDIAAILPHYFEATDTQPGESVLKPENMAKLRVWKNACADAFAFIAADGRFDSAHLGVIGFSLGGNLALNLAMEPPPGTTVRCVVDFFGPTRLVPLDDKLALLPPILIQHGKDDSFVLPDESDYLARELDRVGKIKDRDYFFDLYAGESHGFKEPALTKSRDRTIEFIDKML